jgi:hypothetical protein
MDSFTTLEAVKITGVSRSRIDQMISRGLLELRSQHRSGVGREFSINELAEVMVINALVSLGIDVGSAEMMSHMPLRIGHYHVPEPMLLLVRRHNRLIQTSERGMDRGNKIDKKTPRFGTTLSLQNSNYEGLLTVLADEDLIGVTVIRLAEILARAHAGNVIDVAEL